MKNCFNKSKYTYNHSGACKRPEISGENTL